MPSWQLVGAVFGVDVLATLFALFGWIGGPSPGPRDHQDTHSGWVSIVTVVRIWLLSFGITIVVALIYFVLNKITWLDNLGRISRSKKNTKYENFLTDLQRLTLVHEGSHSANGAGGEYFRFATSSSTAPGAKGADDAIDKDQKKPKEDTKKPKAMKKDSSASTATGSGAQTRGTSGSGEKSARIDEDGEENLSDDRTAAE